MPKRLAICLLGMAAMTAAVAQDSPPAQQQGGLKQRDDSAAVSGTYHVDTGTRILLSMINTVDTRHSVVGDRIYLETAFPVISEGHIVIPQGSWVTGTITDVKHGGRLKGHDQMRVRFDSLTLPNGVSRNFRADLASAEGRSGESVQGDGKPIAKDVAVGAASGTAVGAGVGAARDELGRGIGIGAGAGAAAGLGWALLSHAPNAALPRGSSVEMVLDRTITFSPDELNFSNVPPRATLNPGPSSQPQQQRPNLIRRIPY